MGAGALLRELQSKTQEELSALLPSHYITGMISVLDKAFKKEL
jgi:hypothetical protein